MNEEDIKPDNESAPGLVWLCRCRAVPGLISSFEEELINSGRAVSCCFLHAVTISAVHICSTCVLLSLLCKPLDAAFLSADHPYALKMYYMDVLKFSKFVVGLSFGSSLSSFYLCLCSSYIL